MAQFSKLSILLAVFSLILMHVETQRITINYIRRNSIRQSNGLLPHSPVENELYAKLFFIFGMETDQEFLQCGMHNISQCPNIYSDYLIKNDVSITTMVQITEKLLDQLEQLQEYIKVNDVKSYKEVKALILEEELNKGSDAAFWGCLIEAVDNCTDDFVPPSTQSETPSDQPQNPTTGEESGLF